MDVTHITALASGLVQLGSGPFERESLSTAARGLGWTDVEDMSDLAGPGAFCMVYTLWDRYRLVVCEQMAGVAFAAMTSTPPSSRYFDMNFEVSTLSQLHEFHSLGLALLNTALGVPIWAGSYLAGASQPRCAIWGVKHGSLLWIVHHEGDGQFGHRMTLDLRLVPGPRPALPLLTDLIL